MTEIDKRGPLQMWAARHVYGGIMCYQHQDEAKEIVRDTVSYEYVGPVTITFGHETDKIRDTW